MINVQDVLKDVPHFESFCSVQKLHELVDQLRADSRFNVRIAGTSVRGVPIHHVSFGKGNVKGIFVAFPHCMEPIGGLTVFSLLSLLRQGCPALVEADVEWHVVPCIDPDGALLNEGWSQKPFTLENYLRHFYLQGPCDQVDTSFPVTHKKLVRTGRPSREAGILQRLFDEILPDFYFSLHNAWTGGAFYFLSRDIDHRYHEALYRLLDEHRIPLQRRPIWREFCKQYGEGIVESFSIKKYYDYLEKTNASPEQLLGQFGAHSRDYLSHIKPSALTFTAEIGYVRHPVDESEKDTAENLRKFKLRLDADSKFLATILLEEWDKVKDDLDAESPFYRSIKGGWVLPDKEKLCEGGVPLSTHPTRDVLFNPQYDRSMTEGDLFNACMVDGGFRFLLFSYQIVRLLEESKQTPAVRQATERVKKAYREGLAEIGKYIDFDAFQPIEYDTLAKVQLGSGLIALNSVLEARSKNAPAEEIEYVMGGLEERRLAGPQPRKRTG